MEPVERCMSALARVYQSHPFDMLKERDSVCFLYRELCQEFPGRVPIQLSPGITSPVERNQEAVRVHSEVAMQAGRVDLAVFQDRTYILEEKGAGMPRCFRPPFLTGIELKMSHSASGQNSTKPNGAPKDLRTMAELREYFDTGYVVLLDLTRDRPLDSLYRAVERHHFATLVHIQLESVRWIRPG